MNKVNKVVLYLLLLVPSFLIITLLWSFLIDGKLYYCSDWLPIIDFIPPFIHGPQVGDHFISPAWIVYSVWIISIIIIFLLPLVFIKLINGFKKERSKKIVIKSKKKK